MGNVAATPNADQRGHAAHLRQMDENSRANTGKKMLPYQDRRFCNEIVHDPDENHTPKYDSRLNDLKQKHYPKGN